MPIHLISDLLTSHSAIKKENCKCMGIQNWHCTFVKTPTAWLPENPSKCDQIIFCEFWKPNVNGMCEVVY